MLGASANVTIGVTGKNLSFKNVCLNMYPKFCARINVRGGLRNQLRN